MELQKVVEAELPNGILLDGKVEKAIKVREMNGEDEEAIGALKDSNQLITLVFSRLITEVGGKKVTEPMVKNFVVGDLDFVLVKIRQATYGDEITLEMKCPQCEKMLLPYANLSELPVEPAKKASTLNKVMGELPRGVEDAEGKVHKNVTIHLPTVGEQELILPMLRRNPAKASTTLLTLVTESIGTVPLNEGVFRKMSKVDRDYLSKLIEDSMTMLDTRIEVTCDGCGHNFVTKMDFADFFG